VAICISTKNKEFHQKYYIRLKSKCKSTASCIKKEKDTFGMKSHAKVLAVSNMTGASIHTVVVRLITQQPALPVFLGGKDRRPMQSILVHKFSSIH